MLMPKEKLAAMPLKAQLALVDECVKAIASAETAYALWAKYNPTVVVEPSHKEMLEHMWHCGAANGAAKVAEIYDGNDGCMASVKASAKLNMIALKAEKVLEAELEKAEETA